MRLEAVGCGPDLARSAGAPGPCMEVHATAATEKERSDSPLRSMMFG